MEEEDEEKKRRVLADVVYVRKHIGWSIYIK